MCTSSLCYESFDAGVSVREMAVFVWNENPGEWLVRVLEANAPAVLFWRAAINAYSFGTFHEEPRIIDGQSWEILSVCIKRCGFRNSFGLVEPRARPDADRPAPVCPARRLARSAACRFPGTGSK